jgi:ABC-type microcin C transport system duplicated ATPase subunit YejF
MNLVEIHGIKKYFSVSKTRFSNEKRWLKAVDGVDLNIRQGRKPGACGRIRVREIHLGKSDSAARRTYGRQKSCSTGKMSLK